MTKPLRVLSLGWGVQSWTLAAMIALKEIEPIDLAIHSDTTHEASGTYAHAEKWTPWLEEHGVKVVTVQSSDTYQTLDSTITSVLIPAFTLNQKGVSGQVRRQCTNRWKIMPIRKHLRTLLPPNPKAGAVQLITGISWDEATRIRDSDVAYITHDYPLVDARIKRSDCVSWLENHGLDIPPKSSCVFCPYQSPVRWQETKRAAGPDWDKAVMVDEQIRYKRKEAANVECFVHPYRKPLREAVNIPEDVGAKQLMLGDGDPTCDSGFCFT
jgi:hypothetical protein